MKKVKIHAIEAPFVIGSISFGPLLIPTPIWANRQAPDWSPTSPLLGHWIPTAIEACVASQNCVVWPALHLSLSLPLSIYLYPRQSINERPAAKPTDSTLTKALIIVALDVRLDYV